MSPNEPAVYPILHPRSQVYPQPAGGPEASSWPVGSWSPSGRAPRSTPARRVGYWSRPARRAVAWAGPAGGLGEEGQGDRRSVHPTPHRGVRPAVHGPACTARPLMTCRPRRGRGCLSRRSSVCSLDGPGGPWWRPGARTASGPGLRGVRGLAGPGYCSTRTRPQTRDPGPPPGPARPGLDPASAGRRGPTRRNMDRRAGADYPSGCVGRGVGRASRRGRHGRGAVAGVRRSDGHGVTMTIG
jgi:hypothetical protein